MSAAFLCLIVALISLHHTVVSFSLKPNLVQNHVQRPWRHVLVTSYLSAASDNIDNTFFTESPEETQGRIQELVEQHDVLLFMKGSKLFPQCGFSDTATKILEALNVVDFHTVDVLSDQAIRQGIKEFSQWPTIPQLYVRGQFIGGSDIMLEMYQNGELAALMNETKN